MKIEFLQRKSAKKDLFNGQPQENTKKLLMQITATARVAVGNVQRNDDIWDLVHQKKNYAFMTISHDIKEDLVLDHPLHKKKTDTDRNTVWLCVTTDSHSGVCIIIISLIRSSFKISLRKHLCCTWHECFGVQCKEKGRNVNVPCGLHIYMHRELEGIRF